MKPLLLILVLSSCTAFAQNGTMNFGLQGGYDFQSVDLDGWNIGLLAQFRLKNNDRWYHEYVLSYSVDEYNNDERLYSDLEYYHQNWLNHQFGYGSAGRLAYDRRAIARFQVGIGMTIHETKAGKFSVGWDLATSVVLTRKRHGESILFHYEYTDSTSTYLGPEVVGYSYENPKPRMNYFLEFMPYLDYTIPIGDHLNLSARCTTILPILHNSKRNLHLRLNAGISYTL